MNDVTQILNAIEAGDPSATEQLLPLVYDELRKLSKTLLLSAISLVLLCVQSKADNSPPEKTPFTLE